ncbi:MAG: PAS domain S-box protein [Candidatus Tectomicrobia bacterium]|uniref:PAS domain S-box protein n=1 Tax=Tectimicrobiota bacterium TaxID=2528274 RepID=A0A932HX08_UNCTE|nr:PAS domain S-box protein [Candidatus Tectomicrobia bacterium]
MAASGSLRYAAAVSLLAAAYFGSAKLGLQLATVSPYATVVWPPTGIALASLLLLGHRAWPGVFLGALLANATVDGALLPSFLIAMGNTLEALAGAALVNRFANGRDCFYRPQDTFRYAILAGMGATSISATVGLFSIWLGGAFGEAGAGVVWLTWWLGDGTSVLTIAPLILLAAVRERHLGMPGRLPEFAALAAFTLAVGIFVFKSGLPLWERPYPLSYLCVSPLLWAAIRFGPRETAGAVFVLSGMAVWGRLTDYEAWSHESLLSLQVFLGLISFMALSLAASVHERQATHQMLRRREEELSNFLENAVLGMHWVNAEGIIIWANKAELALLGYAPEEYIGRRAADFHADAGMVDDILRRLERGGEVQGYEARLRRKDGSLVHVLLDLNAHRENGRLVHTRCFTRDISERKRAAEELQRVNESLEMRVEERTLSLARANRTLAAEIQERRHAEALVRDQNEILLQMASGAPLPAILDSIASFAARESGGDLCALLLHGPEGTRLRVAAAPRLPAAFAEAIPELALSPDSDLPSTLLPAVPGEGADGALPASPWAEYRRLAARHGFPACWGAPIVSAGREVLGALIMHHPSPHLSPSEKDRELLESAARMAAIAVERQRTLDEMRRVEERFRLLVEGVQDYAICLIDPHGNVITWNDGAERIKGYRADEIVGRHFSCFYTQEDLRDLRPEEALRLAAENGRHREEGWRVRKDGSRFFASVLMAALRTEDGQLGGFAKVTQDITARKEEQEKLKEYADRLQFLSRRLLELQETERRAIARELHDETGQALTALKINLDLALQTPAMSNAKYLAESADLADSLLRQVRNLSLDLHPSILDDLGLVAALRWSAGRQAQRSGFRLHFDADPVGGRLPIEVETACFRIAQEALTNVSRHAEAKEVELTFRRAGGAYEMVVQDDGRGFDAESKLRYAAAGLSMGLVGMQERAALIGASLDILSTPGNGTRICLKVPLRPSNEGIQGRSKAGIG